ncbi:MAG: nucleoside hydrolase [Erysipelotrichia bacterium]|nr:nucleoside hydrolase [Erysipelotrichia bacterium]
MAKRKLIFDVDTGSDDALALMSALLSENEFEVLGVCTVSGNRDVDNTTENTLRVIELLHKEHIPVIKGASRPLIAKLDYTRHINQQLETVDENGEIISYHAEYLPLPAAKIKPLEKVHAASWYIQTLLNSEEKITLVLTGPLTNFALAYRTAPEILDHIAEIVIMGGGKNQTNSTSASEFNIFFDPEAAFITLSVGSKVPLTMMMLDATHQAYLTYEDAARLRKLNNAIGEFAAVETESRIKAYNLLQPLGKKDIAPIHDALCVMYLLDPTVITKKEFLHVDVVCGGIANGQTLIDNRRASQAIKNVHVCYSTDSDKFREMLVSILEKSNYLH